MKIWLWAKRFLDITIASLFIILLAPLWILLSACIFLEDRGPILYRQKRVGKNGTFFTIYKFRSMRINDIPAIDLGPIKHNHSLVTKVGFFIRRFKLDETPQLINILRKEMSLVGPRPCLPERLLSMSILDRQRFIYLPGLTGWAEINGNVELSWNEQLLLDLWYVHHWSLWVDFKILFKTIAVVLFGSHKNYVAINNARKFFKTNID